MKHAFTTLLCAGLLLASPHVRSAAAQTPDAELQVQLAEARRHFEALEYEQAVPSLDRAIALLQNRPPTDARQALSEAASKPGQAFTGSGG